MNEKSKLNVNKKKQINYQRDENDVDFYFQKKKKLSWRQKKTTFGKLFQWTNIIGVVRREITRKKKKNQINKQTNECSRLINIIKDR